MASFPPLPGAGQLRAIAVLGPLLVLGQGCRVEQHPAWQDGGEGSSGGASASATVGTASATGSASSATGSGSTAASSSSATSTDTKGGTSSATSSSGTGPTTTSSGDASSGSSTTGGVTHRIFLTSTILDANFGGLAGADDVCQAHADQAALGGTWLAVLSTAAEPANTRLQITAPVTNLLGDLVAMDATDLWDGSIASPVLVDEQQQVPASAFTWTGTTSTGEVATDCQAWTSGGAGAKGERGNGAVTDATWISAGDGPCNQHASLYCISQ